MSASNVRTMIWDGKALKLIDQRKLPVIKEYVTCDSYEKIYSAIKDMVVRGAPAIGVTAAYGVAIAANQFNGNSERDFVDFLEKAIVKIGSSRPTAVNLFWALRRMRKTITDLKGRNIEDVKAKLVSEAVKMEAEDIKINKMIGKNGIQAFSDFLNDKEKLKILTHCNAGALATAGYGTALGVIRSLAEAGRIENVVVDETRPYLQGARLTAWELHEEKIPYFIIADNMAAYMMSKNEVDAVVVGADRIAANGDSANKIGTLGVSILAMHFKIPFFIAAPLSTIDINISSGDDIPIEERDGNEIRELMGKKIIPEYMPVKNPSFDYTPNSNISAIITEKSVIKNPFKNNIKELFK
ncbi:MAG: S-methyl-5-thioribose-1-phosphate isomerase [Actinomycetota bacterium]|nr:S-methyl-5-thioribose-1-phosphate isomerase [Actinomycetota bacterium]